MMRRFGRMKSISFSWAGGPLFCRGLFCPATLGLALLLTCAAQTGASGALSEPAGLRGHGQASPRAIEPQVIPPSVPIRAQEERHSIRTRSARYTVQVEYPSWGVQAVDQTVAVWCRERMDAFIRGLDALPSDDPGHFTLTIGYQLFQASPLTVSVVFTIATSTGDFQPGQAAVTSFTFDLSTGRALGLNDVLEAPSGLPSFLSFYSRRELVADGDVDDQALLHRGTAPDMLNFSCFALTPQGLSLFFAPSQVADAELGTLRVDIPLSALTVYHPKPGIWAKGPAAK